MNIDTRNSMFRLLLRLAATLCGEACFAGRQKNLRACPRSGKFSIHAYCLMPDHGHVVTGGEVTPSNTLRYLNGIAARRIVDVLKSDLKFEPSLVKLKIETRDEHKYSVWHYHPNTYIITSEGMMMQKVNYVHKNPVEAGLVDAIEDYRFSSARFWMRKQLLEDEPLEVDIKRIDWRG